MLRLIRAGSPGLTGSVAAGGTSRALRCLRAAEPCPSPAALGADNSPPGGCPARLPRAAWGLAPAVSPQAAPSLPGGVALPGAARGRGGHFPLSSASRASLELSVAACLAPPALPPRDVCGGAGVWVLLLLLGLQGCKNAPEPHTPIHAAPCPDMASPLQAGTPGGQQSQQAGDRRWKPRHDAPGGPCWVTPWRGLSPGCGHIPGVGLRCLGGSSAALAGPVGRRVPGSNSALLGCPFAPGRNYNQSCGVDSPGSCCTLDHIPLVR